MPSREWTALGKKKNRVCPPPPKGNESGLWLGAEEGLWVGVVNGGGLPPRSSLTRAASPPFWFLYYCQHGPFSPRRGKCGAALKCPTGSTLNVLVQRHSEQWTGSLRRRPAHSRRPPPPTDPLSQLRPAGPASPKDQAAPSGPQQPKPRHSLVLPLLPGEPRPHKVTPYRTWPTPRGEGTPAPCLHGKPSSDSSKSTPPLRGVATLGLPLPGFNSLLPPS